LGLGSTHLHKICTGPATKSLWRDCGTSNASQWSVSMNSIIYLVGLVVVILAILSFFGLR
jgi:hypothetical protein